MVKMLSTLLVYSYNNDTIVGIFTIAQIQSVAIRIKSNPLK